MQTRPHPSGGRAAPAGFREYRVCPIVETADFGKGSVDARPVFSKPSCRIDLPRIALPGRLPDRLPGRAKERREPSKIAIDDPGIHKPKPARRPHEPNRRYFGRPV
jgi:hypothetical protein